MCSDIDSIVVPYVWTPSAGTDRGPDLNLRLDSTLLVDISDGLSVDGLFQVKSRSPFLASDPNRNLFINQGAGRKEGGKMKELYVRSGDWRVGKFVQDFGRAYALLASPFADDFVAEPEEGYEPSRNGLMRPFPLWRPRTIEH